MDASDTAGRPRAPLPEPPAASTPGEDGASRTLEGWVADHRRRTGAPLALPIASYPGGQITGASTLQMVRDPQAQAEAILALHERFRTPVLLTCMDLSAEAEAFGATVQGGPDEVPAVVGRRVTTLDEAKHLPVPEVGTARTAVQLAVLRQVGSRAPDRLIIGGVTGPFSLAARLLGVSEALLLSVDQPDLVHAVTRRCATFLVDYLRALRQAGAGAVFMAEPTSGLLSPRGLETFSAAYVREIAQATAAPGFTLILHNCAVRVAHLRGQLSTGVPALHFGAPMDLSKALTQVGPGTLVGGNLDPASVLVSGTPESVAEATCRLLTELAVHPHFVLSTGCDLPLRTPLANLQAFFDTARTARRADGPAR